MNTGNEEKQKAENIKPKSGAFCWENRWFMALKSRLRVAIHRSVEPRLEAGGFTRIQRIGTNSKAGAGRAAASMANPDGSGFGCEEEHRAGMPGEPAGRDACATSVVAHASQRAGGLGIPAQAVFREHRRGAGMVPATGEQDLGAGMLPAPAGKDACATLEWLVCPL
jgi:hypothetical protein